VAVGGRVGRVFARPDGDGQRRDRRHKAVNENRQGRATVAAAVVSDWAVDAQADLLVTTLPKDLAGRSPVAVGSRTAGLLVGAIAIAVFVGYMAWKVPIVAPRLTRSEAVRYWPAAAIAVLIVTGVGAVVSAAVVRRRRSPIVALDPVAPGAGLHVPRAFTVFLAVVLSQTLHMGEHVVQVFQLLVTDGNLTRSHGVIGRLDFETVHFAADTMMWLSLGVFIDLFRGANRWLWVSFAAVSLHQIEHLYLFWIYHAHPAIYASGGFAGIMGSGGVIGSPLGRPYLHFTYNVIVTVPMVIALWDQAKSVDHRALRRLSVGGRTFRP